MKMIRRHSRYAIFIHWFNAVCWLFLLFSGLALLANPLVQPIGEWWTALWTWLFGSEHRLLNAHVAVGIVWIAVYVVYLPLRLRQEVIPFLREIFRLNPITDMIWCIRKGMRLTIGEKAMRLLGLNPDLPPQGFYNAGQKLAAIAVVACSLLLVLTGAFMVYFSGHTGMETLLQWGIVLHFAAAGIMMIVLPIHIYMAAAAPGETPALRSMFIGSVPEDFVKMHNPLWYKKLKDEQQLP